MSGSSGPGAVTRSTLRQQIADALRDEVLAGRLKPGQEFTVKEIAEQYGVSATPVREALVDLSAQGLLDADQHRGFRVPQYSPEDLRGMLEARSLVTEGIFRALAQRTDLDASAVPRMVEAIAAVRRRGEEAQRAALAGDLTVLVGYDLRFWRELSNLFGNRYIGDFLHRLRVQTWVCTVQHLRHATDLRGRLWAGHADLVDALSRLDTKEAHAIVVSYNRHAMALVGLLPPRGPGGAPQGPGQ
ncbi:GntR family transcriptional regulator [Streptomyces sp. NPDC051207]|uniref:GntR family transcriptional regulator n=1 Tax=Streptomyces sp. NPDC051207 TaxID=3154641 RepID=UPI00343AE451